MKLVLRPSVLFGAAGRWCEKKYAGRYNWGAGGRGLIPLWERPIRATLVFKKIEVNTMYNPYGYSILKHRQTLI